MIDSVPAIMLMIEPGTKNGDTRRGPRFMQLAVVLLDHRQTADARADDATDAIAIGVGDLEPAVLQRFGRGRDTVVNEDVEPPRFLGRHYGRDVEALDLAGDPAVAGRMESKRVIGPMPERPASSAAHALGTSLPTGQMTPRPVTTTRRCA